MNSKYKMTGKDIFLISVFLALNIIAVTYGVYCKDIKNVGEIIEQVILLLFSVATLVDVASYLNLSIFVPDFFEYAKERKRQKEIEDYFETYVKEDINFLQDYSQERISFLMSQLGVNQNQFDRIRLKLIKMRCMPLKNLNDAKRKIEKLVTSDYPTMIDQNKMDSSKICYKKVRYYINIMDIMFIPDYASELSSILAFLITEKANLSTIDKLIIPRDGNFLLGVEVGKKLGKSVVKMRYEKGKIETEKCWDGNLEPTDRVIIIHDVLVSGEQIIDTINRIPNSCLVKGLFCLITRKEWKGKKMLKKKGVICHEVLKINDKKISKLRGKSKA